MNCSVKVHTFAQAILGVTESYWKQYKLGNMEAGENQASPCNFCTAISMAYPPCLGLPYLYW